MHFSLMTTIYIYFEPAKLLSGFAKTVDFTANGLIFLHLKHEKITKRIYFQFQTRELLNIHKNSSHFLYLPNFTNQFIILHNFK